MKTNTIAPDYKGLRFPPEIISHAVWLYFRLSLSFRDGVLIFCPVQLLGQWQSELYEKFDEIFLVFERDIDTNLAWHCPRLIVPYGIAQQRLHIEEMLRHRYDLVILDEAHCLNYAENWRILRTMKNLQKKYFLLLSATPMHNSLEKLYNIITLLRPGHFDDLKRFKEQFVDPEDETRPRNTEESRRYLQEVMVRNSRRQVVIEYPFPERDASTVPLTLEPPAMAFYSKFRDFYRRSLANAGSRQFLLRMGEIVERLCSSPDAFREPINLLRRDRYAQKHLKEDFIRKLEDFAGWTTVYCYDDAGNTTKVRLPGGSTTEYIFDTQRNLVAEIDAFGNHTEYVEFKEPHRLDYKQEFGRRAIANRSDYVTPGGDDILVGYDSFGNRPLVCDALGNTTYFYDYTRFGRPGRIVRPDGSEAL